MKNDFLDRQLNKLPKDRQKKVKEMAKEIIKDNRKDIKPFEIELFLDTNSNREPDYWIGKVAINGACLIWVGVDKRDECIRDLKAARDQLVKQLQDIDFDKITPYSNQP